MRLSNITLAAALCGALLGASAPAYAITCDGNIQVQRNGERIITPYCQDSNLAAVARQYGSRVSAQEMRQNPSEKARICRFIGDDLRVRDTCQQYRDDDLRDWQ